MSHFGPSDKGTRVLKKEQRALIKCNSRSLFLRLLEALGVLFSKCNDKEDEKLTMRKGEAKLLKNIGHP
jgi:hypothetical protein